MMSQLIFSTEGVEELETSSNDLKAQNNVLIDYDDDDKFGVLASRKYCQDSLPNVAARIPHLIYIYTYICTHTRGSRFWPYS